jgi:hypothetical protein
MAVTFDRRILESSSIAQNHRNNILKHYVPRDRPTNLSRAQGGFFNEFDYINLDVKTFNGLTMRDLLRQWRRFHCP